VTDTAVRASDLDWWLVKLSHPNHHRKTVFRSVSENRARSFVMRRYPRGSEAYLESPQGVTESYEAERQGDMGSDVELWQAFDPDSYIPVDVNVPPGEAAWSDKEG
jgi:hypothetical protein